jgi:hypothetical protein
VVLLFPGDDIVRLCFVFSVCITVTASMHTNRASTSSRPNAFLHLSTMTQWNPFLRQSRTPLMTTLEVTGEEEDDTKEAEKVMGRVPHTLSRSGRKSDTIKEILSCKGRLWASM